jgi:hypothetical protein
MSGMPWLSVEWNGQGEEDDRVHMGLAVSSTSRLWTGHDESGPLYLLLIAFLYAYYLTAYPPRPIWFLLPIQHTREHRPSCLPSPKLTPHGDRWDVIQNVFYRKEQVYELAWHIPGLEDYRVAAAKYGGPVGKSALDGIKTFPTLPLPPGSSS